MPDTWPMLIAAGYLRRAHAAGADPTAAVAGIARRTGLSVNEVLAIVRRLAAADQRNPGTLRARP